ncbi:hypothetical protein BBP40_010700 [Aspergillus hancockii]|nr:hypothetical protein BBP40_010700 [Aspergillus hancockii]
MRQLSSFFSVSLAITSGTRALDASIFTFDSFPPWQNAGAAVLSDDMAQHLLELRMNVPTASTLEKWDQNTVELLDRYGGPQRPLFGSNVGHQHTSRSLLVIEGIDAEVGDLVVTNPLADFLDDDFLRSLSAMSPDSVKATTTKHCEFNGEGEASPDLLQSIRNCIPKGSAVEAVTQTFKKELFGQIKMAEAWVDEQSLTATLKVSAQPPNTSVSSGFTADLLISLLHNLRALSSEGKLVTAVLLPCSNKDKGSTRKVNPRGAIKETLFKSSGASAMTTFQDQTFPVCFTSNSSCDETTNSCSGHGFCHKKFGSANDEAASDCYACKCKETVVTKEDGTVQKVRWGGPACQKRDISSPFFLIAGISVLVVVAAGTAIGMLYHIGQGELPGVISAGVGPARAQK